MAYAGSFMATHIVRPRIDLNWTASPPSASCSATGMSKAACLLGHDFLRAGELRLLAVIVENGDVVPILAAFLSTGIAPLVIGRGVVATVLGFDDGVIDARELTVLGITAIDRVAIDAAFV